MEWQPSSMHTVCQMGSSSAMMMMTVALDTRSSFAASLCLKWYALHLASLQRDGQVGKVWERGQGGRHSRRGRTGGCGEVGARRRMKRALGEVDVQVQVSLDLSGNLCGDAGAASRAGVLGESRGRAHLDVSSNFMRAEAADRLEGVLGECTARTHLDVSCNDIGDGGARRRAEVRGEFEGLAYLDLSSSDMRAEGAGRLAGRVLGGC
eukprot:762374-Rhodomonas_salina.3